MNSEDISRAERALIGAALIDASSVDLVSLHSGQFVHPLARMAWNAIVELHADSKPIDEVTILDVAPPGPKEKLLGYLGECAIETPTAGNAEFYAGIVRKAYVTRCTLRAIAEIRDAEQKEQLDGEELLGFALEQLSRIDTEQPDAAIPIGEIVTERLAELEEIAEARQRGETLVTGLPTGIKRLDEFLGGIQRGLVTIVAGRPGMGKSSLAMTVADAASRDGAGVHVFSLEDIRSTYADRALARGSNVPPETMRSGRLDSEQLSRLDDAARALRLRRGWIVDDRSGLSANELVRSVRRQRRDNTTQLVIVDYVQLLRYPRLVKSTHEAIKRNLNTLADAAKGDRIAYLVLSQLNRELERREDKRPMMSDLRESGSLEERAKCIIGVYRGSVYGDPKRGVDYDEDIERPTDDEFKTRVDLLVLKNTNGRTGFVRAKWNGPCTKVE